MKNNDKAREANRQFRSNVKKRIFRWYGNECRCCGENNLMFLTLDHINDDGFKDPSTNGDKPDKRGRKSNGGWRFYALLKRTGFESRRLDLQLLCWNCQWGKRLNNGFCPHHPETDLRKKLG